MSSTPIVIGSVVILTLVVFFVLSRRKGANRSSQEPYVYGKLENALSDISVTKPFPMVKWPRPAPVFDNSLLEGCSSITRTPEPEVVVAPQIINFSKPVYLPNPVQYGTASPVNPSWLPQSCPMETVKLRNKWEAYSLTNGKYNGGTDPLDLYTIPSCAVENANHMSLLDFYSPETKTIFVNSGSKDNIQYASHSY